MASEMVLPDSLFSTFSLDPKIFFFASNLLKMLEKAIMLVNYEIIICESILVTHVMSILIICLLSSTPQS